MIQWAYLDFDYNYTNAEGIVLVNTEFEITQEFPYHIIKTQSLR